MEQQTRKQLRILRMPELQEKLGRARSTIYAALDPDSPTFDPELPRPLHWGKSIGFVEHEVDSYIKKLMQRRADAHLNSVSEGRE